MNTALNKKFFSYVIPSILAFTLSGVYTIVDGFFIGQSLGDTGLTAITLGYPISALIGAVGTGLGLSGAIRFTILNAQGETQKRQECFSGTTLLMLLTAGLLTAILFAFAQPILHLLGARGNMLTLCVMYAQVIALGAVFQLLATGFVPFIRNMGGATVAMIAMAFGFATNIALDYVFVWALSWGMAGAAWATIIGQAVTMIVAVIFFLVKKERILPAGTAGAMQALEKCPDRRDLALWFDLFFHHHDAPHKSLSASVRGRAGSCGLRLYRLYFR